MIIQTLFPVSNPRRLQLWVDYFLRFDETAWSTQDPTIQDDDGDAEVGWGRRGGGVSQSILTTPQTDP